MPRRSQARGRPPHGRQGLHRAGRQDLPTVLFITLTCPSYGHVKADGTPVDPAAYDYTAAARDALHFAALFDRFMQNMRRFVGYDAFYLYLRDPDGHRVEIYTADYYTGDPDHETYRWNVHDDRRRDFWGNAVIESWYKEASPVLDLDGKPQPAVGTVLDESAVRVGADGFG